MKILKALLTWTLSLFVISALGFGMWAFSQDKSLQDYLAIQTPTPTLLATRTPFQPIPLTIESMAISPTSNTVTAPTSIASVATPLPTQPPATTPAQSPTQEEQILIEPTLPVPLDVYKDRIVPVRVPLEQIKFLKWNKIIVYEVVEGQTVQTQANVLEIKDNACQKQSLLDNVKRVYQAFKAAGANWHAVAAMVLTESGYKQFQGGNNNCDVLQNYSGAPAYCIMQIYLPAHPDVNLADLNDTDYCINVGKQVYLGMLALSNGDPIQAVACYKGFCQEGMTGKNDPGFKANFDAAYYNSEGISVDGTFVPYDENKLLELFPDWRVN